MTRLEAVRRELNSLAEMAEAESRDEDRKDASRVMWSRLKEKIDEAVNLTLQKSEPVPY